MLRIVWQGRAHGCRKYFTLLATPINTTHHVLPAHAHNLAQYVDKSRQQAAIGVPGMCSIVRTEL